MMTVSKAIGDQLLKLRTIYLLAVPLLCATNVHGQNQRDTAVRDDKQKLAEDDSWFYDDLDSARLEAEKTKRPLMVVFR